VKRLAYLSGLLACAALAGCLDYGLLAGKACDPDGRCLEGWACHPDTFRCVRPWELPDPIPEPIVLHTFEGASLELGSADQAPRAPEVPLLPEPREPVGLGFDQGNLVLTGGRLAASPEAARALVAALIEAGSFSAEVWCQPDATIQRGPARIASLSVSHVEDGLGLGQDGNNLVAWVRSEATGPESSALELRHLSFPGAPRRHAVLTYEGQSGRARLSVDGALVGEREHRVGEGDEARPARLDWDAEGFGLGLGDEADGLHAWRGRLWRFALWDGALSEEAVGALWALGP
jgi:hypothetical protein